MNDKHTILLAEDSESDRFLLRQAFKMARIEVPLQEVHNGDEVIAYLQGDGDFHDRDKFPLPRMILMDLNMPMKNGFQVLAWLRSQPGLKRLSVIVMTASVRPEDVDQAIDCGANAVLVKPAGMENLIRIVRFLDDWLKTAEFPVVNEL